METCTEKSLKTNLTTSALIFCEASKTYSVISANSLFKEYFDKETSLLVILPKSFLDNKSNTKTFSQWYTIKNQKKLIAWHRVSEETQCFYIGQDMTAIEKLQSDYHRLQYIIKKVPGYVFWKDRDCVLLGCNENFAHQVGLTKPEDIIGKTDHDLPWSTRQTQQFLADDQAIMSANHAHLNFEEKQQQSDGKDAYLITSKVPLHDEDENVSGILGIYIDITEKKMAELALIQAKEKAEAANRAKTEFIGSISHDMKSPLSGIVTSAQVIEFDPNASSKDRQFAAIISSSGKQLESFFTSCLDLSKMEMQEWASHTSVFSIKKLIEDVQALYLPKAVSSQLSLEVEYDDALPIAVEGHRDSLFRILLNLVGNGLKFTEKGHVIIRALYGNTVNENVINVILQVEDTGMGIPEDKHEIIFEKLCRLVPSYANKIEGSGIGLYIVDQYIKRMGGRIEIKSKVGEGSTFIVTVPLKLSKAQPEKMISSTDTTPLQDLKPSVSYHETTIKLSKKAHHLAHILVVEDTAMIQLVTKTLLYDVGFSVDIAASGEEAVAMFEPGKYGLIYMDIGLPKMDGYQAAKAIREKEKLLQSAIQTPIIALTGHGAVEVEKFCGDAGMNGILSKPLSREQTEAVWQLYGQHKEMTVHGLTILNHSNDIAAEKNILDIELSVKRMGSKEIAKKMIGDFIQNLETQFLPKFKLAVEKKERESLHFELHRQLGIAAYLEVPLLQQTLLSVQQIIKRDEALTPDLYQQLEKAVKQLSEHYKKIKFF